MQQRLSDYLKWGKERQYFVRNVFGLAPKTLTCLILANTEEVLVRFSLQFVSLDFEGPLLTEQNQIRFNRVLG